MQKTTCRPLTEDELTVACLNIGYDLSCGQCASVFYTGSGTHEHDAGCRTHCGSPERAMKRHGRIRVVLDGFAEGSYAELYLPIEEVASALVSFHGDGGERPIEVDGLFANGQGLCITMERIPQRTPAGDAP